MTYSAYCCPACGELIGWLGLVMPFHKCKEQDMTEALKPCRSPYCECSRDQCSHPGYYDARHEPFEYPKPPYRAVKTYSGGKPVYVSLLEDEKSLDFDIQ